MKWKICPAWGEGIVHGDYIIDILNIDCMNEILLEKINEISNWKVLWIIKMLDVNENLAKFKKYMCKLIDLRSMTIE